MKISLKIFFISFVLLGILWLPAPAQAASFYSDEVIFGGVYTLHAGDTLDGSLYVLGGTASIETGGFVTGSVYLLGGSLVVDGTVAGDLLGIGSVIKLEQNAIIGGDVSATGTSLTIDENAIIEGVVRGLEQQQPPQVSPVFTIGQRLGTWVARLVWFALRVFALATLAVILVLIWPKPVRMVGQTIITNPILVGIVGLFVLVASFAAALIMAVTIILIPVSLLLLAALVLAGVFGWVAIGHQVGQRLGSMVGISFPPGVAGGIGTLLVSLLAYSLDLVFFNLFCVGWIMPFALLCLSLGGVVMSRFGRQVYEN